MTSILSTVLALAISAPAMAVSYLPDFSAHLSSDRTACCCCTCESCMCEDCTCCTCDNCTCEGACTENCCSEQGACCDEGADACAAAACCKN